jgi:hypothetical protein
MKMTVAPQSKTVGGVFERSPSSRFSLGLRSVEKLRIPRRRG